MDRRLPPRPGEWIDRDRPVEFRFEGRPYRGFAGDVVSSSLWANDVRTLGRSFKYHRPRGIYSLAGDDANAIVTNGRSTNLRADQLAIEAGMNLRAVNTLGGLAWDWLAWLGWLAPVFPVGFYYKAFHTPRFLFPFYERRIRAIAGLGRLDRRWPAKSSPKERAFRELVVVGAGPAGLAAALAAAECGVEVMLVDEGARPGGSLTWQWAGDPQGQQQLAQLLDRAGRLRNLEVRSGTQVAGWYADHWLALCDSERMTKVRAQAVVVATGCFEQPAVFGNNDLPGVMLGSAAQRLIHHYAVRPFDRAVVLAGNSDAYRVALDLAAAGTEVAAVADLRPAGETGETGPLGERVRELGIPILCGHGVYEAVPVPGKGRIRAAVCCALDNAGEPIPGRTIPFACDGVVVSVGWAPAAGLLGQAGARFRYCENIEQFVPAEQPRGTFSAGRLAGVYELADQLADGRRAGLAAAAYLGRFGGAVPAAPPPPQAPPSHPYPILPHAGGKDFVDLDEDLTRRDIVHAHQEGFDSIELLKRYSTVGMGPSQGKLANMNAVRILARLTGRSIDQTGTPTARPFHQPVPMAHLAGRRMHPVRRTPMHEWHAGKAEFVHVGDWLRPEYYHQTKMPRNNAILAEARNVRENVGLVDVGTLGKIGVFGPAAADFLERVYTGRFANLPVGRLRYAVACDETGVLIEDGIVARLAPDRFYVTATTTGVAAFYREMQRWAILWGMPVVLANLTGHWTAMNVAGPRAREVLRPLTDVDLEGDAFPYLGVREGTVAGVPATLLRVGFVGELGYEIHVPASAGLAVWDALLAAGRSNGIGPFGVEAQRLLRLEKGHLIIGADTDGLTNPFEVGLDWALGKDKEFYVGQRGLRVLAQRPLTRRLVGIAFPRDLRGPLPDECHLIIEGGQIAGRITSVAKQSTLEHPIALAFVRPDMAAPGTSVSIRLDRGKCVTGTVTALPFYDPGESRQR